VTSTKLTTAARGVGEVLAELFLSREMNDTHWASVSKAAGLDDQRVQSIIVPRSGKPPQVRRGTLLKIAATLELDQEERSRLSTAAGHESDWLAATVATLIHEKKMSMRRAVLLLTGPTDPYGLHFHKRLGGVSTRSGVVFGWHDVVVRLTTPKDVSVLEYTDALFRSDSLRTLETILLRDDLPMYVDSDFPTDETLVRDYRWATIFVQALGDAKKPEFVDVFREVANWEPYRGCIHLLTAAVAVGQFDSVIEVLASNLDQLKNYVRAAQAHARDQEKEAHTVTYIAEKWRQRTAGGRF